MSSSPGLALCFIVACAAMSRPAPADAQIVEVLGSRALGMGGAFVAVANDSSATWWNPAGLADGPFLDVSLARNVTEVAGALAARRDRAAGFSLATPPLGLSYYRLRITQIPPLDPTAQPRADREDRRAGTVDSLDVSQLGATFIHTLIPGIHAATTLKYLRGTARTDVRGEDIPALDPDDHLDRGDDLAGGDAENRFDVDVGVLAVAGAVRLGAVARNLRRAEFGDMRLPRQIRIGAAFNAEALGRMPLVASVDADVRRYQTGTGERRVIALGAERWFRSRELGIRAGARFNTVGAEDRAATAGVSVAVRAGLYLEGHVVRGGDDSERGWGLAARISF